MQRTTIMITLAIVAVMITGCPESEQILACLLPLLLCWYLLRQPVEAASDQEIADLLIGDLVAVRPLLLSRPNANPGAGLLSQQTRSRRLDEPSSEDASDT